MRTGCTDRPSWPMLTFTHPDLEVHKPSVPYSGGIPFCTVREVQDIPSFFCLAWVQAHTVFQSLNHRISKLVCDSPKHLLFPPVGDPSWACDHVVHFVLSPSTSQSGVDNTEHLTNMVLHFLHTPCYLSPVLGFMTTHCH